MVAARRALITGISGQDGSYLAELLLSLGYEVHGLVRPPVRRYLAHLDSIRSRLHLWPGDIADTPRITRLVHLLKPDEIYNLAAITFQGDSWSDPNLCFDVNARAVVGLLDAIRKACPGCRFFQAGTSELFGQPESAPQSESTPFRTRSPYGLAKQAAHLAVQFYREKHEIFAVNGIMFNHESPRRGPQFVTRKISLAVARILSGIESELRLGDLNARRDWGHAADFVRAMHAMLSQTEPTDLVIGTGQLHSVEQFVASAFGAAGLDWRKHVVVDPAFCRPPELVALVADATKAQTQLGWQPTIRFPELVAEMTRADIALVTNKQHAVARAA